MVKDAEAHAEEDKKRRELVEAKNQAEALIHSTEKTLEEGGDKVPAGERQAVEAAIRDLKSVSEGADLGQIRAKTETLAQAAMKIGEAMYKAQGQAQSAPPPGGGEGAAPGGDKVVDADFEEVDDQKKRGSA
ncbi:MAG TPA: Hsp70 family protein, partial [Stellaceae bacterium]|nr:Hsp70 family protein [Stellaceae bacterium]